MTDEKVYKITGFRGQAGSGLATVVLEDEGGEEVLAHVESGHGMRVIANVFGSIADAIGHRIRVEWDDMGLGMMAGFEPVEEEAL